MWFYFKEAAYEIITLDTDNQLEELSAFFHHVSPHLPAACVLKLSLS